MDHLVRDLDADDIGVEQEADVGLEDDLFIEQQIPLRVNAGRIAGGILEAEFLHDAGLAAAGFGTVAVGANDVHFDFAGSVAAQHGSVLHKDNPGAIARGG